MKMKTTIIETNENGVIWADVDGITYGLAEDGTLIECDSDSNCTNCTNSDAESIAKYEEIKLSITENNG